jgi:DNA-binding beta-propeller fold protein YncE
VSAILFTLAFPGAEAAAETPGLLQLAGTAGCVTLGGSGGACATGVAIDGATGVAVSPDGRNVYVAASASDAIAVFDRDLEIGALVQKAGTAGCVSEDGSGGACADGVGLDGAERIAVSGDARNVYVASNTSGAVAVFDRDTATGALTQKAGLAACISEQGSGGDCVDGFSLLVAVDVVVSGDGRNVYVAGVQSRAIGIFDRNPLTGALTQKVGNAGCLGNHTRSRCWIAIP